MNAPPQNYLMIALHEQAVQEAASYLPGTREDVLDLAPSADDVENEDSARVAAYLNADGADDDAVADGHALDGADDDYVENAADEMTRGQD